ncbi:MAG: hypothetical protein M1282_07670 [Chloroflexi bacterium]|nr:hypothetical protein [Chloroflexota bacterium]
MRTKFVERRGKIEQMDRSFDLKFWQAQPPKARFDASWELIVHYMKVKGLDVRQLRLQRSVTHFQRPSR